MVSSDKQPGHHPVTPDLHPPGSGRSGASAETQSYRGLWLSLAAVLVVGLLVVFALPALVSQSPPVSVAPVTPVVAPQVQSDEAAQAMQDYLQLRAKLELENVPRWGEADWSQAAATAASGSRQMAQRQYSQATASYTQARQRLEQLVTGREARLSAALAAGEQALAVGDVPTATERFQQVLLIEPQHQAATRGLARAAVRVDVLQAMSSGARAEAADDPAAILGDETLMAAVDFGHQALARWLLEQGADPNARSGPPSRHTALHSAAWNGDTEMVRLLLEAGADKHLLDDEHENTPQGWAEVARTVTNNPVCAEAAALLAGHTG